MDYITLAHGSGGKASHQLIEGLFYKHFQNDILLQGNDASILHKISGRIAVSTDSFVIHPIFFPGGDIGKLSVYGTVNDLAMTGAKPLYITLAFIIEEGFSMGDLEKIVASIGEAAKEAGVKIVAGDTKVVESGSVDQIYINTTGIGILPEDIDIGGQNAKTGDKIIISGTIGDHGTAIMALRKGFEFSIDLESDCGLLSGMIHEILHTGAKVKVLRDPTRGGLATTLNEISKQSNVGLVLEEAAVPVKHEVRSMCEILGLDPIYIANEGKLVVIVAEEDAEAVLGVMKSHPMGKDAAIIGTVVHSPQGQVYVKTEIGGTRILQMPVGELLPRIC